jgi:p-cumate 2,3-dioxygenase beta subunit
MGDLGVAARPVTRAEVEDFLFTEAELLDSWRLQEWLDLLTEDAAYYVPPNDRPDADHRTTLFTIADDAVRLRERVLRILDPNCHAEFPRSRTRRLITNVRIVAAEGVFVTATANFVCYRFRRDEQIREYVGTTRHLLRRAGTSFRIKERRVVIDAHELGSLGSVSFIL